MCFCEDSGCGGETAQISNYKHPPWLSGLLQASSQSGGKAAAKMLIKANIWMYVFQLVVMKGKFAGIRVSNWEPEYKLIGIHFYSGRFLQSIALSKVVKLIFITRALISSCLKPPL